VPSGLSTLDSPSTVTYSPPPHPTALGATIDLPQTFVDSARQALTFAPADTITITDQGSPAANMTKLNDEVIAAAARDSHTRIILSMGLTFEGQLELLPHAFAGRWTYIEAETAPCAEGTRCTPATMTNAPTLHCVGNDTNTVRCRRAADNYRIMGTKHTCETNPLDPDDMIFFIVAIMAREPGLDELSQSAPEHAPINIILDRIWIDGSAREDGFCKNGLGMYGRNSAIVDSYITGQHHNDETHGILVLNTPGPIKIVNNFVDSGSIPVMFGGGDPAMGNPDGKPTDVEIRRNHVSHNEAWCPPIDGDVNQYFLKGLLEFKNAQRVLVEGNVFERCPNGGQEGMAIVIKGGGGGLTPASGCGTAHVTFRYNLTRNVRTAFNVQGLGDPANETGVIRTHAVACYHNLFYDVGVVHANGDVSGDRTQTHGHSLLLNHGTIDLKVRFNTWVHNGANLGSMSKMANVDPGTESTGFDFSDNVSTCAWPSSSWAYDGGFEGTAGLNKYATGYAFARNMITGLDPDYSALLPQGTNVYPPAASVQTLAEMISDAGFVDAATHNYRLAVGSPGKGIALGGADPGCNMDDVELATTGVAP
jgi:hypothetical protein